MPDELSQPQQSQVSQITNHKSQKRSLLPWILGLIIILAIGIFFLLKEDNQPSPQDRIDVFFTLDKIVRTDIPEEKLSEYKTRMAAAKANTSSPDGDINFRAYMEAASVKKGVGDYEGARDIWEYVNIKRPKNSVSFANLGDLYANFLKDPEKSETNYLKAIENDPSDSVYVRGLLELYQYHLTSRLGFQESIFLKAAEANQEKADFWLILANYYELAKNYNKAIESWKKIQNLDPAMKTVVNQQIERIRALTK